MFSLLTVLEINIFRSSPQKAFQTFTTLVKFRLSQRYFSLKLRIYAWLITFYRGLFQHATLERLQLPISCNVVNHLYS
jgi:hypothetical protein